MGIDRALVKALSDRVLAESKKKINESVIQRQIEDFTKPRNEIKFTSEKEMLDKYREVMNKMYALKVQAELESQLDEVKRFEEFTENKKTRAPQYIMYMDKRKAYSALKQVVNAQRLVMKKNQLLQLQSELLNKLESKPQNSSNKTLVLTIAQELISKLEDNNSRKYTKEQLKQLENELLSKLEDNTSKKSSKDKVKALAEELLSKL